MTDIVTIRGFVATSPSNNTLPSGIPVSNFRVASTPRWYDSNRQIWREGTTNWYTVNTFRALAQHTARSIFVGQPVIVTGRLHIKQWETDSGRRGTAVEIDASAVGHDLNMGVSSFSRAIKPDSSPAQNEAEGQNAPSFISGADARPPAETENTADTGQIQQIEEHANSTEPAPDPF